MRITLRAARVNAGLTLPEASKLIGVHEWTLRQYEKNNCVPRWSVIKKIEEVYGIPVSNIILEPELNKIEEAK